MEARILPNELFPSPPLTKPIQGKIFSAIGKYAENKIAISYQAFTGRQNWYPAPIDAPDFRDGNNQLNSKTLYYSFLIEKNKDVDKQKLEFYMNRRAIRDDDGQLLYIPDFISDSAPAAKRFYEVKPGRPEDGNAKGEEKIASVHALMQDVNLSYEPGDIFRPNGVIQIFNAVIFVPGAMIFPLPVRITFEYKRHNSIQGLLVYYFRIKADFLKGVALALVIAIILAILFPDILDSIPLPPFPIPFPVPFPPQLRPNPVPPLLQQFRDFLDSFQESGASSQLRRRAIAGSVGARGHNARRDVQTIQFLLNAWQGVSLQPLLAIDGIAGPFTVGAITTLQQASGLPIVDGRVDPDGPTLEILGKLAAAGIALGVRASRTQMVTATSPLMNNYDMMSAFWAALIVRR